MNFNTFIASVQLCDAMVDLARSKTMSEIAEMTAEDLAAYIYSVNYAELTGVFDKVTNGVYSTDTEDSNPDGVEHCEEVNDGEYDDEYEDNSYEEDEE